jgi:hypothetical protein
VTTTASVYFNKIRVDYPQAGKDNDSQGFRDNFRNIFNAFSATNVDLEQLQLNTVTLGGDNDFGYNTIKKASLQSCVTKIIDYSTNSTNGNIYVNFREGNYQKYSLAAGDSTFYIENWPDSGFAEMRLSVTPNSSDTTRINFGGNLVTVGYVDLPVIINSTDTQTFDLWSDDGGLTIYIQGIDLSPTTLVYDTTNVRIGGSIPVSYLDGQYQKFTLTTGTSTVSIANWPVSTNTVALMSLSFKTTTTAYVSTLTFQSDGGVVEPVGGHTYPYTISTTSTQFFDVWTDNGGSTVYVLKKGV